VTVTVAMGMTFPSSGVALLLSVLATVLFVVVRFVLCCNSSRTSFVVSFPYFRHG